MFSTQWLLQRVPKQHNTFLAARYDSCSRRYNGGRLGTLVMFRGGSVDNYTPQRRRQVSSPPATCDGGTVLFAPADHQLAGLSLSQGHSAGTRHYVIVGKGREPGVLPDKVVWRRGGPAMSWASILPEDSRSPRNSLNIDSVTLLIYDRRTLRLLPARL